MRDKPRTLTDEQVRALKSLVDHARKEDEVVRQRQILVWKKLKLYWDGFQRLYFSTKANDWRVPDLTSDAYSGYYEKTVNVFSAYLESLIAALSIDVPRIRCVPNDAENALDVQTARAGDQIAKLIAKHNDASLLWIHSLFILCTEGMVAGYTHSKSDNSFGTYREKKYKTVEREEITYHCPTCHAEVVDNDICPRCMMEVEPITQVEMIEEEQFEKEIEQPKTRQMIETFGGLHVKVPIGARKQEHCTYLVFSEEIHWALAEEQYQIGVTRGSTKGADYWERWGRISPEYSDFEPDNTVTVHQAWIRPALYNTLNNDDKVADSIRKKFPTGVKITIVGDDFAEAEESNLDDHWTLTYNPVANHLQYRPLGERLINIQDITNDMIALVLQTMEHGIGQMYADPAVVNFQAYSKAEVSPGAMIPAVPKAGKSLSDSFFESRTSNQAREVEPILGKFQDLGQLVSGALPSLFGGPAPGSSRTAAEYSMSRAQALQRLQINWKMLLVWWEKIFAKAIPAFIQEMKEDEKAVTQNEMGAWINTWIRLADTMGKIGAFQIEGSENLPVTMAQKKDALNEIIQTQNPAFIEALTAPENIPLLREAMGVPEFKMPGQMDIEKQQEEIQLLLMSEPILDEMMGEVPSVPIDQELDNHSLEAETGRRWLVSPAGRLAKTENSAGYRNVLLHTKAHMMAVAPPAPIQPGSGANPNTNRPEEGPVPMERGLDYGPAPSDTIQ